MKFILHKKHFLLLPSYISLCYLNLKFWYFYFQAEKERKQKEDEVRMRRIKYEQEETKSKERERYLNSMGRTSKSKQGVINANYTSMLEDQKIRIAQKDLKDQEKVLRDHCLVMGHVNEYFLA